MEPVQIPMKNRLQIAFAIGLSAAAIFQYGCQTEELSPWDEPMRFYADFIEAYHDNAIGKHSRERVGKQAVFVDFSDGLVQAYSVETNRKVIDYISQKMVGSAVDWYGLGKEHDGIVKLDYANDRDIYNKVISPASYSDIMSPIEKALETITASKNDALLITDFEEYTPDRKEQKYAYAKDYFTRWLAEGNTITMFYCPYTEKNIKSKLTGQKTLFFVVFTYGEPDENSLVAKFEKAIEGREELLRELRYFHMDPNPYVVSNDYGGKDKTGLTPDDPEATDLILGDKAEVLMFYVNGYQRHQQPYEAMEMGLSLDELHELYFGEKGRFARKLFLNASQNEIYNLKGIRVNVTDVTEDYVHFIKCQEAVKPENKPVLVADDANNMVWDENTRNNPVAAECYKENTTELKPEYVYGYRAGKELEEVFAYDDEVFTGRLKNSPDEIELVTNFHKNFVPGKFTSEDEVIVRVDYVIDATEEIYSPQLEEFKWTSVINKANGVNESLYESIRNAIQAVKPEGILFSYYLKFPATE